MGSAACVAALTGILLASAGPAQALITPAVTLDGPSSAISDFGGVSMASDGTGGLVYVKSVEGVPHVFASRFVGGSWGAPIRVDWAGLYEASQPRIAASPKGALLVVWATGVATVHGNVQYGLYSARLGAGGSSFGPPLLVDPSVGKGVGVDPSLAATSPGKAIVAYRAIVNDFGPGSPETTAARLRPGDVMADVRVARLSGDRWARLGAVNRNPEASMRPPSEANGPQVGAAADGGAVVAWQEPDQSGAARIWMRRIFGTTPGPILQASPTSWEGRPVTADADALSLSVTPYALATAAFRIAATGGSVLGGRLLTNTLPANFAITAGTLNGAQLADGAPSPNALGAPDVAAVENSSRKASAWLGFLGGSRLRLMGGSAEGALTAVRLPPGPSAEPGASPVVAADPEGGGLVAYPALDAAGLSAVAVRQEFVSGAAQTGLLSGAQGGPVSELALGRSGGGDGLIAFRQGDPGRYQIVAERASVPPAPFIVKAPKKWSRPGAVKLSWEEAPSAVGGLTYSVLLDGRPAASGLSGLAFHPRPAQLGNGIVQARVLATDALGQQVLSEPLKLRVDGQPPTVRVRVRGTRVRVRIRDAGSGVKATKVSFGDGAHARGSKLHHLYAAPGRYRVLVRARDAVGNRVLRSFEARAR